MDFSARVTNRPPAAFDFLARRFPLLRVGQLLCANLNVPVARNRRTFLFRLAEGARDLCQLWVCQLQCPSIRATTDPGYCNTSANCTALADRGARMLKNGGRERLLYA